MHKHRAFSLVELSIVLVILGLLTGGILAGQSLIRAAELRSVTTEYQRWITATQAFRDKYFALPGDFSAATRVWGRLNSNADCVTNSSASVATNGACDGDGSGMFSQAGGAGQSGEVTQYWRQLTLSGLIEGNYTGLQGAAATPQLAGSNVPSSRLNGAGWYVNSVTGGPYSGNANAFYGSYDNFFGFGGAISSAAYDGAILKPEEAWNIDTKIDDGKPGIGKVMGRYWNNACAIGAATSTDTAIATYNLANSTVQCSLYFVRVF